MQSLALYLPYLGSAYQQNGTPLHIQHIIIKHS